MTAPQPDPPVSLASEGAADGSAGAARPAREGTVPAAVGYRPYRARIVCWIGAAAFFLVFAGVSLGLRGRSEGVAVFHAGDQIAMAVLGLLGALAILWFSRPRVWADAAGIRVRNLLGDVRLPWDVVERIRFDHGASFATLELLDDEVMSILAIQKADGERAVVALRELRALLAAA